MVKRQTMAQLFRDLHKIEAQVALLRLDLQAARVLPKTKIEFGCMICGGDHGGLPCPQTTPMCSTLEMHRQRNADDMGMPPGNAFASETICVHEWGEYSINNAKSPLDPPLLHVWVKCIKCGAKSEEVVSAAQETGGDANG